MSVTPRGSPPRPTPLDSATVKEVQTRIGSYMTRPQIMEANKGKNNNIVDADTAREYLETSQWLVKDAHFTRSELFSILMKIALLPQTTLKGMAHTIRALAFLGEEIDREVAQEVASACGPAVSEAVSPVIEGLHDSVKELIGTSSSISKAVEDSKGEIRALEAQVRELKTTVEAASAAATTAATEAQAAQTAAGAIPTGPRSHAAVVGTPAMTAGQAAILAHNARMRRQIMLDKDGEASVNALVALTELELKEKANLTLTLMTAKLEGAGFVGARKLDKGGVVLDCKNDAMAAWIRGEAVMKEFMSALGGSCVYRPRNIMLIAEMVPIEMRVEDAGMWRMVEGDSGLEEGTIVNARWVKAPKRRTPNQKVAHLKVEFANAEAANHAIDYGFFWQGRNIRVHKSDDEPRRCVKCQKFDGHLAYACKSAVNICGCCAEHHRTADCPVLDSEKKCANCQVSGHAAADRVCPFFQKEVQKKRARDLTTGYRYIPTADPKTWVTIVGPAPMQNGADQALDWGPSGGQGRLAGGRAGQGGGEENGGWGWRVRTPATGANNTPTDGLRQMSIADSFGQRGGARGGGRGGGLRGRPGPGPSPLGRTTTSSTWFDERDDAGENRFPPPRGDSLTPQTQQQDPAATVGESQ